MWPIYSNIRKLCFSRGLTIRKLEQELDFSNGTIRKWDKSIPSSSRLTAVANYFNVPIEALTGDPLPEEKENPATVNSNEELEDAIRRGKNAYFNSLFDRASPEVQDEVISLLLEKLRNQ